MKKYLLQTIISIFLFLIFNILIEKEYIDKNVLIKNNFNFINNKIKIPFINQSLLTRSEKLNCEKIESINDYYKIYLNIGETIPNIKEGTVIFIGNLENKGKSIIVRSRNNVEFTYSNLDNISVNLYDYINDGEILGNIKENYLILTILNNGKKENYENYI